MNGSYVGAGIIVVLLCLMATVTGYVFIHLNESNDVLPEYVLEGTCTDSEGNVFQCSGKVSVVEYDESSRESIVSYIFDIDGQYGTRTTLTRDADGTPVSSLHKMVGSYVEDGVEISRWSDLSGMCWFHIGPDGKVLKVQITLDGLLYTAKATA